jgi:DNA (cytosine-5)-methyltransferase 1
MPFKFIDLFSGIGGFHAALEGLGGECVYAVEIDPKAAAVYERNWGINPLGDITNDVNDTKVNVPSHDVLAAGFPCQPFSKSGMQRGMDETRGTLYWNILKIIQERRPALVILENVRNLAGPRHLREWQLIIETLREQKYQVCDVPAVFSPHLLPPDRGGRPQIRERVYIIAIRDDQMTLNEQSPNQPVVSNIPIAGWDPQSWDLEGDLPLERGTHTAKYGLNESELHWVNAWDDFVVNMLGRRDGQQLPGFPLWGDEWRLTSDLRISSEIPQWKATLLRKNASFYTEHKEFIDFWANKWEFYSNKFPTSKRKLEWQAQDTPRLWETVMHFRPSGIRAKRATYVPAVVAITQTSIIGPHKRRMTPREVARLQGLPDWFDFGNQPESATYKQLGNGINIGALWHVIKQAVNENELTLLKSCPQLVRSVQEAPSNPDSAINRANFSY